MANHPENLSNSDLDAFAQELKDQNFGDKAMTLYDIRAELNDPYKDRRTPYVPPSTEEIFYMLTKETPQTFCFGKTKSSLYIHRFRFACCTFEKCYMLLRDLTRDPAQHSCIPPFSFFTLP